MKYFNISAFIAGVAVVCFFASSVYGDDGDKSGFTFQPDDQSVPVVDGGKLVFAFNYAFLDHENVPKNEPRRFAGDYVYPLYGVLGENLLDDAPKDHYHHHGVFWTWPGVFVHEKDGTVKQFDLWTSNTAIRQRFIKFHKLEADADRAVLTVENGWYIGGKSTVPDIEIDAAKKGLDIAENEKYYGEKIVSEFVSLTVHPETVFEGFRVRSIDFKLTLIPTTKDVSLQGAEHKSYGGLTIRFCPQGNEIGKDKFITTDEGVAKEDMPEKKLRWADYTSLFGGKDPQKGETNSLSGAAIFLAPDFPDFPPTWLTRYYGPLCVGFPGVVAQRFEAGKPVEMNARIWIHEGLPSTEVLTRAYEDYANNYSHAE